MEVRVAKRNKHFKMPEPDRGPQYMLTKENVLNMVKDGSIKDQHFLIRAIAGSMQKNALVGDSCAESP